MAKTRGRRASPDGEAVGYQGKEFTCIVQAPSSEDIEFMIQDLRDYADEHGLEQFEVLQQGPDPDGGYRAVIVAHNWNPLAWLSERYQARAGGPEARAEVARKRRDIQQRARLARLEASGRERIKTEEELAAEEEKRRRERLLRRFRPSEEKPAESIEKIIFG